MTLLRIICFVVLLVVLETQFVESKEEGKVGEALEEPGEVSVDAEKDISSTGETENDGSQQDGAKQTSSRKHKIVEENTENKRGNKRKRHRHRKNRDGVVASADDEINVNVDSENKDDIPTESIHSEEHPDDANTESRQSEEREEVTNGEEKSKTKVKPDLRLQAGMCTKCGDKEKIKEMTTEMIKQDLLNKLHLSSVPKVGGPIHPLPFDFYVGESFTVNDEPEFESAPEVETKEIFIFGEDITDKCLKKRGTGCYSFNITDKNIDPDRVSSVELWVYKQRDRNDHHIQTFMVSELSPYMRDGKEILRFKNIVKRIETRLKYGWMKIYVKRAVLRWLSKPQRNHGLAIVCKTCQRKSHRTIYGDKEGHMPLLVFYMNNNLPTPKRAKRAADCIEGGSHCCHKESLEINFRDLGWDFIMVPNSIWPNYCVGSCNGIQAAFYNYTRLVQSLQQSVQPNYPTIQPCCSPVSFRAQSLMYMDHFGVVRKILIPDMIVKECGCS